MPPSLRFILAVRHHLSQLQLRTYSSYLRPSSVGSQNELTHVIIGGGVVGLAIAARLARRPGTDTLVLERHGAVGTETSSRNSEVIHAGIYYPKDSLKTKLCMRGAKMLYDLCGKNSIPHQKIGKWIVAQSPGQYKYLQNLHTHATSLGIPTRFLTSSEAATIEPHIRATHGILESPNTGIIDSHAYMLYLESLISDSSNCDISVGSLVTAIHPHPKNLKTGGYRVWVGTEPGHLGDCVTTDTVINCAGLGAVDVANLLFPEGHASHRKAYYAKGNYFSYTKSPLIVKMGSKKVYKNIVGRLIYPAVEPGALGGLGTHLTLDLGAKIKFGPDVEWVDDPTDLTPNPAQLDKAVEVVREYFPEIKKEELVPDYSGIRPKLAPKGAPWQDFIVKEEEEFPGVVNLLAIESPGLTASLAIAELVEQILYKGCDMPKEGE